MDTILERMEESIVGFGSQMFQYAIGRKDVKNFLRREYAQVAPCKIIKMRLRDRGTPEEKAVVANVILSTMREASIVARFARGCGLIRMPLRVFSAISVLKIAVEVGFVVGITAAITPTGSAMRVMP